MLEVIGFLVWILITLGFSAMPFAIAGFSGLAGGFKRSDAIVCLAFACLAIYSWYYIFLYLQSI